MVANNIIVYGVTLIPSGQSIAIKLNYEGILITGGYTIQIDGQNYNPLEEGLAVGDIITHINETRIESISILSNFIKENTNKGISNVITVKSNNNIFKHDLNVLSDGLEFTTGLYVKDSIMGIGTLTYFNPATNSFASLGHSMSDIELTSRELLKNGEIYFSEVTGVIKGNSKSTGQKIAGVYDEVIGDVNDHTEYGIYGILNESDALLGHAMETASVDEIELGEAYFLTVINDDIVEECLIEIVDLKNQREIQTKGITFEITDKEIIEKTGGIIQGMSGSPIIQNNKIIGCVTHVSSSNPEIGYGLYIEWMLEIDDIIE